MTSIHVRSGRLIVGSVLCLFLSLCSVTSLRAQEGGDTPKPESTSAVEEIDSAWAAFQSLPAAAQEKVDPRILAELRGEIQPTHLEQIQPAPVQRQTPNATTRFIVLLQDQPDLSALDRQVFASAADKRLAVASELNDLAERAQSSLRTMLAERQQMGLVTGYQPFSVVNAIVVEGDLSTVTVLAQRADVARIVANYPLVRTWDPSHVFEETAEQADAAQASAVPWNITFTGANRVWSDFGVRGEGAVVGGFDTGVVYKHPALLTAYRGYIDPNNSNHNYNWFEPDGQLYPNGNLGPSASDEPYDCDYLTHGTHTMGTMVGDGGTTQTQIGVAPGARWIAVPGICGRTMSGDGIADDIGGLKAFQWFLCPTDLTGNLSTADCSKAPDVINNSWGSANPVSDVFQPALRALRAAGTSVVFAAGNTGRPGSIGSPAHLPEALTVGAVDVYGNVAYFSSRGPSFENLELKPNLSAPGVEVYSSVLNDWYIAGSGTSMASPHVAGITALLVSADLKDGVRDFSVDEIERFVLSTVVDLGQPGPEYDYGAGVVSAYEATRWLLSSGELFGVIRDGQSAAPVANAEILGRNIDTSDQFTGTTDSAGMYSLSVPAGRYFITVQHWAYQPSTLNNQRVVQGSLSTADFQLVRRATASLTGTVRDASGPVADARIVVATANNVEIRSGADGGFNLDLPTGMHTLRVEAKGHKYFERAVALDVNGSNIDVLLTQAPSILLVNADASAGWFYGWPVHPFVEWALREHGYVYDLWNIQYTTFNDTNTLVDGTVVQGVPSTATLLTYDLVIWVHSGCSGYSYFFDCAWATPSAIGASDELAAFLDAGGRLLISGQDLGREEGDQTLFDVYLKADLISEAAVDKGATISGRDFLDGLSLEITNASLYEAPNSASDLAPDGVATSGGAFSILSYDDTSMAAALAVAPCTSTYRAVYLAMGYENIAPIGDTRTSDMSGLIDRSIGWLTNATPITNFHLTSLKNFGSGEAGSTQVFNLLLENYGRAPLRLTLSLSDHDWPVRLVHAGEAVGDSLLVPACSSSQLRLEVDIPTEAEIGASDVVTLTVSAKLSLPPQQSSFTTSMFPQWRIALPMSTLRYDMAAASPSGSHYVYVMGGRSKATGDTLSSMERYQACANQWSTLAPIPEAISNFTAASIGNQILVVGGYSSQDANMSNRLWIYNIDTDSWRSGANLPLALGYAVSAVWNGKLYLFGGYNYETETNTKMLTYDPATEQWQVGAELPFSFSNFALSVATWQDEIYLLPTSVYAPNLHIYNPATNTWRIASAPETQRYASTLIATQDHLYLLGGYVSGAESRLVERYDPAADTWSPFSSVLDPNRIGSVAAAPSGRLLLVGGLYNQVDVEVLQLERDFCNSTVSAVTPFITDGQSFDVEIVLEPGQQSLSQVTVEAPLPQTVMFVGFVQNPLGATYMADTHTVRWQGSLSAAQAQKIVFTLRQVSADGNGERYQGVVVFDSAGNRFEQDWWVRNMIADFSASEKQANSATVIEGQLLTYTLTVGSRTPIGGSVIVSDSVPAEMSVVANSLTASIGELVFDPVSRLIQWVATLQNSTSSAINVSNTYLWVDSDANGDLPRVDMEWVDISETGQFIVAGDDAVVCGIPFGFDFPFYNDMVPTLCVNTNGYVSLGRPYDARVLNCPMPNGIPVGLVAGHAQDMVVDGGIYVQTVGEAPNRRTIVQWHEARRYYTDAQPTIEFQIVFYESGDINIYIQRTPAVRNSYTVIGVQSVPGNRGTTYKCGGTSLHDELAVAFLAPGQTIQGPNAQLEYAVMLAANVTANHFITNTAVVDTGSQKFPLHAVVEANPLRLNTSSAHTSKDEVPVNEPFGYRFELRNTGLFTATQAELINVLPDTLTYLPDSLSCTSETCSATGNQITWRGSIPPGGLVTVAYSATVGVQVPDRAVVTNTAQLNDGYGTTTTLAASVRARQADFSASFVEVDPVLISPGDRITYTIYLRNSGGGSADVTVVHALPQGLTYEAGTLWCGAGACQPEGNGFRWQGSLPPRGMTPIRMQVQVDPTLSTGTVLVGELLVQRPDQPVPQTLLVQIQLASYYYLVQILQPYWHLFMADVHISPLPGDTADEASASNELLNPSLR